MMQQILSIIRKLIAKFVVISTIFTKNQFKFNFSNFKRYQQQYFHYWSQWHFLATYSVLVFFFDISLFFVVLKKKNKKQLGDDLIFIKKILKIGQLIFFLCGKTIQGYILIELKRFFLVKTYKIFFRNCFFSFKKKFISLSSKFYQFLVQWKIRFHLSSHVVRLWLYQFNNFFIKIYLLIQGYWLVHLVSTYFQLKCFKSTRDSYIKSQNFVQKFKYFWQDFHFFIKANMFFMYSTAVIRLKDLQLPYNFELGYPISWSNVGTICEAIYQNNGFFYWTINTTLQEQLRQKIKTQLQPPLYLDNSAKIPESNVLDLAQKNWSGELNQPIFSETFYKEIYEIFLSQYKLVLLEELKCDPLAIVHQNMGTFTNLKTKTIYNEYLTNNGIIDRILSRWQVDPETNSLTIKVSETTDDFFLPTGTSDELLFRLLTSRGYWKPEQWFHPKASSYWYELFCEIYASFFPYHFYWAKCVSSLGMGGGVLPTFAIFGTSFYYNPEFILAGFYFIYYIWFVRRGLSELTAITDEILPEGIVIPTSVYLKWVNEFRFDICLPYLRFDPWGKEEEDFIYFLIPWLLIPYYIDYWVNHPWKRGIFEADYSRFLVSVMRYRIYGDKEKDPYLNPWLEEISPLTILMDFWHTRSYRQIPYIRNLQNPIWAYYDTRIGILFAKDKVMMLDHFEKLFQQINAGNSEDCFSDEMADAVISMKEDFLEYRVYLFQGYSNLMRRPKNVTGAAKAISDAKVRRSLTFADHIITTNLSKRRHVCDLDYSGYLVKRSRKKSPLIFHTFEWDSTTFRRCYQKMLRHHMNKNAYVSTRKSEHLLPYWTLNSKVIEHVNPEYNDSEGDIDSQYLIKSEGSLRSRPQNVFRHFSKDVQRRSFYNNYYARNNYFVAQRGLMGKGPIEDAAHERLITLPNIFEDFFFDTDRDLPDENPLSRDLEEMRAGGLEIIKQKDYRKQNELFAFPLNLDIFSLNNFKQFTKVRDVDGIPHSTYSEHTSLLGDLFTLLDLTEESKQLYNRPIPLDDLLLITKIKLSKMTPLKTVNFVVFHEQFKDDLFFSLAHTYTRLLHSGGTPLMYWISPYYFSVTNKLGTTFNFGDYLNSQNLSSEALQIFRAQPNYSVVLSKKKRDYQKLDPSIEAVFCDSSPRNTVKALFEFQKILNYYQSWRRQIILDKYQVNLTAKEEIIERDIVSNLMVEKIPAFPLASEMEFVDVTEERLKEPYTLNASIWFEMKRRMLNKHVGRYREHANEWEFLRFLRKHIEQLESGTTKIRDIPMPGDMLFLPIHHQKLYMHIRPNNAYLPYDTKMHFISEDTKIERQGYYFNHLAAQEVSLLFDFFTTCTLAPRDVVNLKKRILGLKDDPDLKDKPESEFLKAKANLVFEFFEGHLLHDGPWERETDKDKLPDYVPRPIVATQIVSNTDHYYSGYHSVSTNQTSATKKQGRSAKGLYVDASIPKILSDMQLTSGPVAIPTANEIIEDRFQIFDEILEIGLESRLYSFDLPKKFEITQDFYDFYYGVNPLLGSEDLYLDFPYSERLFSVLNTFAQQDLDGARMMPLPQSPGVTFEDRFEWVCDGYLPPPDIDDDESQRMDAWYRSIVFPRSESLMFANPEVLQTTKSLVNLPDEYSKISLKHLFDCYEYHLSYNMLEHVSFRKTSRRKRHMQAAEFYAYLEKHLLPEVSTRECLRPRLKKVRRTKLYDMMMFYDMENAELLGIPDVEADAFSVNETILFEQTDLDVEDLRDEESSEWYAHYPSSPGLFKSWNRTRESLRTLQDQTLLLGVYNVSQLSNNFFNVYTQARSVYTPVDIFGIYCENSLGHTPYEWFDIYDPETETILETNPFLNFEFKDGLFLKRFVGFHRPEHLTLNAHSEFSLIEHIESIMTGFTEMESVMGLEYALTTYWSTYFRVVPGQVIDALVFGFYWSNNWLQILYQGSFFDSHLKAVPHSNSYNELLDFSTNPTLLQNQMSVKLDQFLPTTSQGGTYRLLYNFTKIVKHETFWEKWPFYKVSQDELTLTYHLRYTTMTDFLVNYFKQFVAGNIRGSSLLRYVRLRKSRYMWYLQHLRVPWNAMDKNVTFLLAPKLTQPMFFQLKLKDNESLLLPIRFQKEYPKMLAAYFDLKDGLLSETYHLGRESIQQFRQGLIGFYLENNSRDSPVRRRNLLRDMDQFLVKNYYRELSFFRAKAYKELEQAMGFRNAKNLNFENYKRRLTMLLGQTFVGQEEQQQLIHQKRLMQLVRDAELEKYIALDSLVPKNGIYRLVVKGYLPKSTPNARYKLELIGNNLHFRRYTRVDPGMIKDTFYILYRRSEMIAQRKVHAAVKKEYFEIAKEVFLSHRRMRLRMLQEFGVPLDYVGSEWIGRRRRPLSIYNYKL